MRFIAAKPNGSLCAFAVLVALCGLTSAHADILTVVNTDSTGPGSLRQAIIDAQDNDTIIFADNVRGAIETAGESLHITKGLTIIAPGGNLLAIDGAYTSRIF